MKLWNVIDQNVLRRLPLVVPVSAAWETTLATRGVAPRRLHTIGNSTAILRQDTPPAPTQLPGPDPHLLYAGRLSPEKGIDILLDLWPEIRQRFRDAQLWVLGASNDTHYQRRLQTGRRLNTNNRKTGIAISCSSGGTPSNVASFDCRE